MNCTALDATITHGEALAGDVERMVFIGLLATTSVALLVGGERFARPLAAAVGGGAFAVFAYVAWPGDCTPRLVAGGVAAALGVPITLFLFHNGITLVAATATGALAHTIATALPVPDVDVAGMAAVPVLAAAAGGGAISGGTLRGGGASGGGASGGGASGGGASGGGASGSGCAR